MTIFHLGAVVIRCTLWPTWDFKKAMFASMTSLKFASFSRMLLSRRSLFFLPYLLALGSWGVVVVTAAATTVVTTLAATGKIEDGGILP
jgi:hypothetical protein